MTSCESRWRQTLTGQESLNDIISRSGVIMQIDAMSCVRLDISLESPGGWERLLRFGWDGCNRRIASGKAIATTVDDVLFCTELVSSSNVRPSYR